MTQTLGKFHVTYHIQYVKKQVIKLKRKIMRNFERYVFCCASICNLSHFSYVLQTSTSVSGACTTVSSVSQTHT